MFFHGSHFIAEATACQLKNISMCDSWSVENSFNDYYAKWHADGVVWKWNAYKPWKAG